ncbi:hypothetical protein TRSC58_02215 [Trypanosoma rangeli SC58]|uniref:Uncharacterized protein n=1 Tax=Trypanosoma rangeli SC58 TaxID=429131 RepID=A0A061J9X9_TRYRA|nr:hypothetical protein TRSC58_02215 [Trypanosoma rangeli SC58]
MLTWTNMAFAGYDMETAEILLKDSLGVSYRLQPTWKTCERSNEIMQSGNDDDVEEEFTESECSASYVSSASTYVCSEEGDGVPIEDGVPKEIVKVEGTECDRNASCVHDLGGAVAPVHGTLLTLREGSTGDKENLPIVSPCTEITLGDLESLHTVIVLGYSENGDVLLLPMPRVVSERGVCVYRCLPALQLSVMKLCEYYDCIRKTDGDANRDIPSFKLPLREDAMTCPHLEQTPLRQVYNVSTDRVYYLSAWTAYVQFVGVAWGVPWLRVFSLEVSTGNTRPACGEEANAFSCIKPLCSCHGERQLCELYGLCEWAQTTQTLDAVTAPALPIADAVGEDENWKSCWEHIRRVSEASPRFTSGGDSLASPPLPFTPRKWQRASELNSTDGGAVLREPSLLPHVSEQNCTAASGVATNYDVTASALEPFGVLHGDHLVGMSGTFFEGQAATVLGVHMGRLLLRLEGDQEETVPRGVEGKDELMSLFAKISAPKLDDQVKRASHSPDAEKSTSLLPLQCDGELEDISNFDRSFAGADAGDGDRQPFVLLEEAAQTASEGRWEGNESATSDGEIAPQSLLLTSFLKAVAYWKMQLFSEEDQRQHPLAFVEYYGTDSQRRMLEAVDLLQRHKSFFVGSAADCSDDAHVCLSASQHAREGRPVRVHRIVQLLAENETGECR